MSGLEMTYNIEVAVVLATAGAVRRADELNLLEVRVMEGYTLAAMLFQAAWVVRGNTQTAVD